jgi:hypothetical protein
MKVLCKSTRGTGETRCCICGLGFVMFWDRQSRSERKKALAEIQKTLRGHHKDKAGPDAHPVSGFLVPEWNGPVEASSAGILGKAPTWAL